MKPMIHCDECGVYFFTIEGRTEHDRYCIGYNPAHNEARAEA